MAPDGELALACPRTLPADFGDWDNGLPPETLPSDFDGFDEERAVSIAVCSVPHEATSISANHKQAATSGGGSIRPVDCSDHLAADVIEPAATILSIPESGADARRMTIIALGLFLLFAAGLMLYYSLRPASQKTTASPAHNSPEVYARTAMLPASPVVLASPRPRVVAHKNPKPDLKDSSLSVTAPASAVAIQSKASDPLPSKPESASGEGPVKAE